MRKVFLTLAATALFALPALAVTPAQVQAEATTVLAGYVNLSDGVNACPDGACTAEHSLVDALAALEAERSVLHSERQSLGTGNYTLIDALISQVDNLSGILSATMGGWDQEG